MTVFILGAGIMQIPAIRTAKDLGWRVGVADGNPQALGADLADRFFPVDLKDRDGLERAARELRADGGLDGVFTAGTDFSASVAWVAERLGLPGIPFEAALRASDKQRMREALAAAGVPSPRFSVLEGVEGCESIASELGFPLVVKPVDSMGARGCRAVEDLSSLRGALASALPHSRTGRVIVEEYIEGPEFSIDAIVADSRIAIRGLADRHIAFHPYFVELGHTMPTEAPTAMVEEVLRVFEAGVRAVGITRGAAKGDIKYCPSRGSAMVGEIAARLSGGYMSGWTYPYASGIDVTAEALLVAVGIRPAGSSADRGWVSAERAFISIPGRVEAIVGLLKAERLPYVKELFCRVVPGDEVVFPTNNVEKCGNAISQAPDRPGAVASAEAAIASILVRLSPRNDSTEAFLSAAARHLDEESAGRWPPPAFALPPEARAALRALPEYGRGGVPRGSGVAVKFWDRAESIEGKDWSGRNFLESARLALELGRARWGADADEVLDGRFWRALATGGAQAALYVIDGAGASRN